MELERAAYDVMPNAGQLFEIARIGVCLAKDLGKMRQSPSASNAHLFLADTLHYVELDADRDYQEATHKFIGRIGRVGYRQWSMRIAEPYWINSADHEDGYRAMYSFEWSDREVTKSQRWLNAKVTKSTLTEDEEISYKDGSPVPAEFLNAIRQYEFVSSADTEELIIRMQQFSEQTTALARRS